MTPSMTLREPDRTARRPRGRTIRAGISLVELMVAMAIATALLTATAVALNASVTAFHVNQQQATLLQTCRLATHRIIATIRRSKLHAPDSATLRAQFAAGATVVDTGIDMFDDNGNEIDYRYDSAGQRILVVSGGTSYPLLEGVTAFSITMQPMRSADSMRSGGSWDLLRRADFLITVKATDSALYGVGSNGRVTLTLSASVMPRKNAW